MEGGEVKTQDLIINKVYKSFALSLEYKITKRAKQWERVRFPTYAKYDEGHISSQNHGTKV